MPQQVTYFDGGGGCTSHFKKSFLEVLLFGLLSRDHTQSIGLTLRYYHLKDRSKEEISRVWGYRIGIL